MLIDRRKEDCLQIILHYRNWNESIQQSLDETEESRDPDFIDDLVWIENMANNSIDIDEERGIIPEPGISIHFLKKNHKNKMILL